MFNYLTIGTSSQAVYLLPNWIQTNKVQVDNLKQTCLKLKLSIFRNETHNYTAGTGKRYTKISE